MKGEGMKEEMRSKRYKWQIKMNEWINLDWNVTYN